MNIHPRKLAVLSVTDKNDIDYLAKGLIDLGFEILSTGGTATLLKGAGLGVTEVSDFTGFTEILGGRVKTLHPKIHGGLLMKPDHPEHAAEAAAKGFFPISIVAVNLYRFAEEAVQKELELNEAMEYVDIGGVTLMRAAAKNYQHVLILTDPSDYEKALSHIRSGCEDLEFRKKLARKAFAATASYDQMISHYFRSLDSKKEDSPFPASLSLSYECVQALRYGENPHQSACFYAENRDRWRENYQILHGKELSYNNFVDLDATIALACEFPNEKVAVVVKHTNPCGVAVSKTEALANLFKSALATDSKSPFGGIVAVNTEIDAQAARTMSTLFLECIAAPSFSIEALGILKKKKNLRLLKTTLLDPSRKPGENAFQLRSSNSGILLQSADDAFVSYKQWKNPTKAKPSLEQLEDLEFGMKVVKHVKSNAIVLVKAGKTLGIGAGQMNRVTAAKIAVSQAKEEGHVINGCVLASDAFFPFGDTVTFAAEQGIRAIAQPGGSMRDQESIDAADAAGISMVFTGQRHFKH